MPENRRETERKEIQVIVHFNFQGHEKVFESWTKNLSSNSMFIEAETDILELMNVGETVVAMLEYEEDLFVKIIGYVVRIDLSENSTGFAIKFLDINSKQEEIISKLL